MSNCELKITLDKADGVYQLGDVVKGRLALCLDKDVEAKPLKIDCSWFSHGKGNSDQGGLQTLELHQGALKVGLHQFDFEFVIDAGPLSYHGEFINIDWQLEARLDIAWKLDPKVKQAIFIKACEPAEAAINTAETPIFSPVVMADSQDIQAHGSASTSATWQRMRKVIPFVFIGLFILFGPARQILNLDFLSVIDSFDLFKTLFFGSFIAVFAFIVYRIVRNYLAEKKLGKVEFSLQQTKLAAGAQAGASLSFIPKQAQGINAIYSVLRATEHAVSGSGTNRTSHSRVIYNQEIELPVQLVNSSEGYQHQWQFTLPSDAPHSFDFASNRLSWCIEVYIDIPNCPDWHKSLSFELA